MNITLGPFRIESTYVGLKGDGNGVSLEFSASGGAAIGPIQASVSRLGFVLQSAFHDGKFRPDRSRGRLQVAVWSWSRRRRRGTRRGLDSCRTTTLQCFSSATNPFSCTASSPPNYRQDQAIRLTTLFYQCVFASRPSNADCLVTSASTRAMFDQAFAISSSSSCSSLCLASAAHRAHSSAYCQYSLDDP